MSNPFTTKDPLFDIVSQVLLGEKKLTDAELKKREEIAQAMERENPGMDMGKKMAIATAQAKKVAEEVETLDELSQVKLANYVAKAATSLHNNAKEAGQYDDKENANKAFKRYLGIKSAAVRLRGRGELPGKESAIGAYPKMKYKTEEVEVNEAEDQQQNLLLRAMAQDPSDLMKMKRALKAGDKALTNPILRQEILKMLDQMMSLTTTDKSLLQRTRMGFHKAKTMKMPEEVQLEAIGAKDKQDEGEYGYEGDMAMSQLRTIIRNCEEMMKVLDKETDLPEWVQSKITLATDYLQTANDYLMSELEEEVEQIDELSDDLMKRYEKKAEDDMRSRRGALHGQGTGDAKTDELHKHKMRTRLIGTDRARHKLMGYKHKREKLSFEEVELGEADEKEVGKEIKAARLKKDSSEFMSKSSLFSGGARDVAKHLGKKDDEKYGEAMKKVKDTPVSKFVASRKGDGKVRTEEVTLDEAKKTTHEDPLITVHKDGRLQAHAHLSTINDIHGTSVKHTAIHAGGAKVKTKYGDNLEYKLSKHHAKGVQESVGSTPMNPSYRKIPDMVAQDPPFEGGREVKSTKSAAERVKKIAKGMEKHYNKDKK